ncbi:glycosyltransferase family 4 protein [Jiella sp. M17.18]|uniref:glycosyltransferase family 4 protein n=1 Tax=Jiella sp. M17.18 TaxID=3234247 RepID=UPI0034DFE1D8
MRFLQYLPELERRGLSFVISPLFKDDYVEALYGGRSTLGLAGRAMLRRFSVLWPARELDLIWMEQEALPWMPWLIEGGLLPRGIPLILDCDDAVFHRYDMHSSRGVRWLLGSKIDAVMRRADLVAAGNGYLAARARSAGAPRVEVVPTVVDAERYRPRNRAGGAVTVGWIGSPSTTRYLDSVTGAVSRASAKAGFDCVAIGAKADQLGDGTFSAQPWTEAAEVDLLQDIDIGIMPLPDTPWARGKCGYKLIQYMACGKPVVASPVGVNTEIVRHGENGFLAETEAEWEEALTRLARDPELRQRMGASGRRRVEREYSLQVQAPRVVELIRSVVA